MRDFLTNITTLSWWISVVIVGILINIFSAYLKDKFDGYLSSISSWWRYRSEAQRAKRESLLNKLRDNSHEQVMTALDEMRNRVRSIQFFLMGGLHFGIVAAWGTLLGVIPFDLMLPPEVERLVKILFMAAGALYIFAGLRRFDSAVYLMKVIAESRTEDNASTPAA